MIYSVKYFSRFASLLLIVLSFHMKAQEEKGFLPTREGTQIRMGGGASMNVSEGNNQILFGMWRNAAFHPPFIREKRFAFSASAEASYFTFDSIDRGNRVRTEYMQFADFPGWLFLRFSPVNTEFFLLDAIAYVFGYPVSPWPSRLYAFLPMATRSSKRRNRRNSRRKMLPAVFVQSFRMDARWFDGSF